MSLAEFDFYASDVKYKDGWMFGREDEERLRATCPDEVIEEFIDNCEPGHEPDTLDVFAYEHLEIDPESFLAHPLDHLLEILDEEYGDPDEATEPTEGMKKASKEFCEAVIREYHVWTCKAVAIIRVDLKRWMKENVSDQEGAAK